MKSKITLPTRLMLSFWNKKLKLFLLLTAALLAGGLQAQTTETLTTTTPSPWAPPAGVGVAKVECWSGGGAGGSTQTGITAAGARGGGGAGGSYAASTLTGLSASYSFSVGAGGVGAGTGTFTHEQVLTTQNGGDTNFGSGTIIALGGPGGKNAVGTNATSAGGVAPIGGNTGTTKNYGGNGGSPGTGASGGGGGSAGSTGNGGNGAGGGTTAGAAGTPDGAAGGSGKNLSSNGVSGGSPGGGGSSASISPATASAYRTGGSGGNGQIKITYYSTPTHATGIGFSSIATNQMTISWTNGNGANRLVLVKAVSAVNGVPVDGTNYTANAAFGSGNEIGSGNFVVYNGTGNSVIVTGLTAGVTYYVTVFENNGATTTLVNYNTVSAPTSSQATTSTAVPLITLGSLSATVADAYQNGVGAESSYTVTGSDLTAHITVTAPNGFKVLDPTDSQYKTSIVLPQSGGIVSATVFVRLEPNAVQNYSGDITHTSTTASQNRAVTANGLNAIAASVTAPANNANLSSGVPVTLTANVSSLASRLISTVVFKDNGVDISGTVSNNGSGVYSIDFSTSTVGKHTITVLATDAAGVTFTSAGIDLYLPSAYTGNKYAQSAITWSVGPWFDATSGGNPVTAPVAGDNVFTQGNAVTITDDATCDNLTFTNVAGQIGIAAGKTLTVRGQVDCTTAGSVNPFSTSDATSTLKLTGETLSTPFLLVTGNATSGMKPNNVIVQSVYANTYQWGTSTATYTHGTGSFTVANGTQLLIKSGMYFPSANNHFQVEAGATVTTEKYLRQGATAANRAYKATIDGTLITGDYFTISELTINGKLKTSKSTNSSAEVLTFDGWWGNGNFTAGSGTVASFGTPKILNLGNNSTIEFDRSGNQNVNGIVPANGTSPTSPISINYANLTLSGSGTKTIQSNLTFTGTLNVATGVTLAIPSGVTLTVPVGATLTGASGSTLTVASGGAIVNNGTIAITPTVSVTPIDTYSYNGTPQGPVAATNSGSGSSYTFSYTGTGTTSYGPSATLPTNAGTYTATATVAADGYYVQASSAATAFKILTTDPVSAANTQISSLTLAPSSTITVSGGGSLVVNQNTTVSAVNVAAGGNLTVNTGVTLGGTVTLESTADATATMVDKYATPTQAAVVKQFVEAGRNWYVSTPISGAAYGTLDKGNSVVTFNEVTGLWDNVTSGTLTPGKGYIQVATAVQGTQGTLSFGGTANSGDITVSLSRTDTKGNGYNLVGNPYPSYLSWSKITKANTNVMSTAWFRTKKTVGAGGGYTFATVNAADTSNVVVVDNNANTTITKYIPPMQAYWVRLNADASTTNYTVNNAMRSHADNAANKMKAPKQNTQQLVRLRIANNENADDAVVYFNANASDNFDNYDSPKMFESASAAKPEIYTQIGTEKLVINGLSAIPYDTEIPVGFVTKQDGNYSIAATELLNIDSATKVLLKDKQNPSVETELTPETVYNFYAPITPASSNRFSLLFRAPGVATGFDNVTKPSAQVFVNAANQIMISAAEKSNYAIYNAVGQLIENGIAVSALQTVSCKLQTGIYVVKVNNQTTRVVVK